MTRCHFLCSSPYKVGDIVCSERTVYPAWWQFWRKPRKVREWLCVASSSGSSE